MSSFIRTLTVGSGLAPDLLTFQFRGSARGLPDASGYRRWGVSPRPENGPKIGNFRWGMQGPYFGYLETAGNESRHRPE